jgi:hypothetical protein
MFGFDTCEAPTVEEMQAWRTSPYRAIGIYIGGVMRMCGNAALNSPAWVQAVVAQGWHVIPVYVGPQAPCSKFHVRFDAADAVSQGTRAAEDAVSRAVAAGIPAGAPIYFDLEGYNVNDPTCGHAVRAFLTGWTDTLHARGYVAALYSSLTSGIAHATGAFQNPAYSIVDAVWIAAWNDVPNILGFPAAIVPDTIWGNHQRIHQFQGDHDELWGGVKLNIDTDVVDGPTYP